MGNIWSGAKEGSSRIAETIGFKSFVKSNKTKNKESRKQRAIAEANRPIPIPDEESLRMARRRRADASTGRTSTILSDGDMLGSEDRLGA
jgi:hypothetical protein